MAEVAANEEPMPGAPDSEAMAAPGRRDFLSLVALAGAAIGTGAWAWTLIDSMNPAADTLAAGAPIDLDLKPIKPGQQVALLWRGTPILVIRHTPDMQRRLRDPAQTSRLADPNSQVLQQPSYAQNWHRSINPEFAVLVGVCTHLGCLPAYTPKPDALQPMVNWPGGYYCHCHGSKYDLVGRVFRAMPAPYNLPVPPYHFLNPTTLRVGENPPGENFNLQSVVQM